MPGISIHVVDVSRGLVAAGMAVTLLRDTAEGEEVVAAGAISATGVLADDRLNRRFVAGAFTAVFHVAAYYRAAGVPLPEQPFLDVVRFRFGVAEPDQHYHLPMKVTPWGYSCFRGGA